MSQTASNLRLVIQITIGTIANQNPNAQSGALCPQNNHLLIVLVAHTRAETLIALRNERCRRNVRATPPKKAASHLFSHPPVAIVFGLFWGDNYLIIDIRLEGGCRTAPARSVAGKSPSENRSRYTGVSQLHSHQSRYTVPLSLFCNNSLVSIPCVHTLVQTEYKNNSVVYLLAQVSISSRRCT